MFIKNVFVISESWNILNSEGIFNHVFTSTPGNHLNKLKYENLDSSDIFVHICK